jgi:NAD(P)-dependent dehydrogenase (short-subunit alcohol dehydrogenase family)
MHAVLRDGLLSGVAARIAGEGRFAGPVRERLAALGAGLDGDTPDVLVWDASASAGEGVARVRHALDGAWETIRAVHAPAPQPGLIVLLAPSPGDAHAAAARAGLENLSRTLSIEWARYGTRPVTLLPGADTEPGAVTELVAYLASPAGGYFAGCAFDLA